MDIYQNNSDSDIEIIGTLKSSQSSQTSPENDTRDFETHKYSLNKFNLLSELKSLSISPQKYIIYVNDQPVNVCSSIEDAKNLITYYSDKVIFQYSFHYDYNCSTVYGEDEIEIYGSYKNYLIKYDRLLFRTHFTEIKEYEPPSEMYVV